MASTPWQTVGPFFNPSLLRPRDADLAGQQQGEAIEIVGHLFQEANVPVPLALIEIWQADADGRYADKADGGFTGFGRAYTDGDGAFRFRTVKPGPVPGPGNTLQAPHILFSIFAAGLLRRVVTRLYFPDEPLNENDPVLACIDDPAARRTLVATGGDRRYGFDIVLRGETATAFILD